MRVRKSRIAKQLYTEEAKEKLHNHTELIFEAAKLRYLENKPYTEITKELFNDEITPMAVSKQTRSLHGRLQQVVLGLTYSKDD